MSGIFEKLLNTPEGMRSLLTGSTLLIAAIIFGYFSISIIRTTLQNLRNRRFPEIKSAPIGQKQIWQNIKSNIQNAWRALQYLTTHKEWRYKTSWYLLLGEQGSGKTSLIKSIRSGHRQRLLLREQNLAAQGAGWNFFNGGIVIDIEGKYFDAEEDTPEGHGWDGTLELLQRHRPERPLDGIILTIPADALQGNLKDDTLQKLGDKLYKQLWKIQKLYSFILPIYIIITKSDKIRGFKEYWQPFDANTRQEIFGWSNDTALDNNFTAEWINKAFNYIENRLHTAQLAIAAGNVPLNDPDEFFLFPENFKQLQVPIRCLLEKVFEESAFHESFFMRGLYFTGLDEQTANLEINTNTNGKILFADQLFEARIFPEKNLVRVVHQSLISRNQLIRRIQYGTIAGFLLLCTIFVLSKISLDHQVESITKVLHSVQGVTLDCMSDTQAMHELLVSIAQMDGNSLSRPGIPISWLGSADEDLSEYLAKSVFANAIFPNMECLFHKKLQAMIYSPIPAGEERENVIQRFHRTRKALYDRINAIEEYEQKKIIFKKLSLHDEENQRDILKQFSELTDYLYHKPLPPEFYYGKKLYEDALQRVVYEAGNSIKTGKSPLKSAHLAKYQKLLVTRVSKISQELQTVLLETARMPGKLSSRIEALQNGDLGNGLSDRPISFAHDVEDFASWFNHLKADWLLHDQNQNSCSLIQQALKNFSKTAKAWQYPVDEMTDSANRFNNDNCYVPFTTALTANRLAGIGQLFGEENHMLTVQSNAGNLLDNLSTLSELSYLGVQVDPSITPVLPVRYWDVAKLHTAIDYYAEYESFVARHSAYADDKAAQGGAQNSDVARIYRIVIQAKLQQVIMALVKQAQQNSLPSRESASGARPLSAKEESIAFQIQNFKKVSVELQQLRTLFAQSGWQDDYAWLTASSRGYAVNLLEALTELVNESRLYEASSQPRWDAIHFADALYDLNDDIQIKDYLRAQQSRIEYITYNYAEPVINYIINTDEAGFQNGIGTISLWQNTLDEVNRHQRKDPASRLNQLDQYFLLNLTQLNQQNCATALSTSKLLVRGHDIFSQAQKKIEHILSLHCQNYSDDSLEKQYVELAEAFNQLLAGHFPFANPLDAGRNEAEINQIKTFFDLYRNHYVGLYEKLKQYEKEARYREAIRFTLDLEAAAKFFNAIYIKDKDGIITPQPLRIKIDFRLNTEHASGDNQIINWNINNGLDSVQYPDGKKDLAWLPGQPLRLSLRWATGSSFKPVKVAGEPQPDIADRSAIYAAGGQWALIQFLKIYKATGAIKAIQDNPNAHIVEFNTPITIRNPQSQSDTSTGENISKTYLRISLYAQDPLSKQESLITIPNRFPVYAPEIKSDKKEP